MDLCTFFDSFKDAYENAIQAIGELREQATDIISSMESIVESCENIENEF